MANLEKEVRRLLRESDELRRASQIFAAVARLARVEILSHDLPQATKPQVTSQLESIKFSEGDMAAARASARETLEKALRILTIGGTHTFEELAWIVTLRTEFWLVATFIQRHGYGDVGISSAAVDNAIMELTHDATMKTRLESADRHVRKHGVVSLVDVGLFKGTLH